MDLYSYLGVLKTANTVEIRRAYRNLCTKHHPDKGGDAETFKAIQTAFEVLNNHEKRQHYDQTGMVARSADEEFLEIFSKGTFKDPVVRVQQVHASMADQIIMHQGNAGKAGSHTAGFEAWMRSRGSSAASVFDAESAATQFGVVKSSYQPVPVDPPHEVFQVLCTGPGKPEDVLSVCSSALSPALEWREVAVDMVLCPINPADVYSARLGGVYGGDAVDAPYVGGHDGVGIVSKVGPGVKLLQPGDIVIPAKPFMGTWRTRVVWPEIDIVRIPADTGLSLEYIAMGRELCLAYCLLEQYGNLKPGDCIILNSANSTVGQAVLQISKLLKLRAIAVVRDVPGATKQQQQQGAISLSNGHSAGAVNVPTSVLSQNGQHAHQEAASTTLGFNGGFNEAEVLGTATVGWDRMANYLKAIGATEVLRDTGSFKVELDKVKFFSRPKLALDSVGGESGLRLIEALAEGGELVMYGCMSGRPPPFQWQSFVFKGLRVSGFNLRKWLLEPPSRGATATTSSGSTTAPVLGNKLLPILKAVGKLVAANLISLNYTEYDLTTEFSEALDHAMDRAKNTKVLLNMKRMSSTTSAAIMPASAVVTASENCEDDALKI
ncbi:hypothetical protein CEUSTIGMA_g7993.t1 [Chlamydomonas eustigma]|uniref:enoyl-[acyl-carrier-protein] reductase n=1 Tax=Chlamydomonas eustigma TaxID=1157962 RepID=A0A250XBX6_9CHLO|nr:hypothetical protein CEUSTIGMA_g7993.t1 [Chlamydomonas eustigma]|eukprot:GAX80556.1 hypothetical protein CEUSTIGMA_g7993.t1 [Chlamydomonas eustigma]